MGQTAHPEGFRLVMTNKWASSWYPGKSAPGFLKEDADIRARIKKVLAGVGVRGIDIIISRKGDKVNIVIRTSRPGPVIGKAGAGITKLKEHISDIVTQAFSLDVEEVKNPNRSAVVIAHLIASQLERRMSPRIVVMRAADMVIEAGAKGVKILVAGRLGGVEMARKQSVRRGRVPASRLRADMSFCKTEARLPYATLGVRVLIYRGDMVEGGV